MRGGAPQAAKHDAETGVPDTDDLLREVVPSVVAECAAAAVAHREGQLSVIDLMSHEMKLRDLINKVVRAHATLPEPTGLRTDEFTILDQDDGTAREAHAPMAFCPEAALVVHAPIMLGRIAAIATDLLRPGEQFNGLRNVKIRKAVRHNLRIKVARQDAVFDPATQSPPAINGNLAIDGAPAIAFAAWEIEDEPVTHWIDNEIVASGFESSWIPGGDGGLRLSLRQDRAAHARSCAKTMPEAVQLILEAMVRVLVVNRGVDGRGLLLSRIRSVSWPQDLVARLDAGVDIEVYPKLIKDKRSRAGWYRLPVSYQGIGRSQDITATAVVMEGRVTLGAVLA